MEGGREREEEREREEGRKMEGEREEEGGRKTKGERFSFMDVLKVNHMRLDFYLELIDFNKVMVVEPPIKDPKQPMDLQLLQDSLSGKDSS